MKSGDLYLSLDGKELIELSSQNYLDIYSHEIETWTYYNQIATGTFMGDKFYWPCTDGFFIIASTIRKEYRKVGEL